LADSLQRHPTDLTVIMVGRIANSGQKSIAKQPIESIYQLVINHPRASVDAKETAQAFLKKLNE
jgi:predicted oxidoreductase